MSARADEFDLGGLRLNAGEGRRIELSVGIDPLELGGERYEVEPEQVPVELEVSRMTGGGYALKLSFEAALTGTVHALSEGGRPRIEVQAREIDKQGEGEELESPYVRRRDARPGGLGARRVCAGRAGEGPVQGGLRGAVPDLRGGPERGGPAGPDTATSPSRIPVGEAERAEARVATRRLAR